MGRRRIAIACQGGGSQCAFVAGALEALFAERIQDRCQIVGLSGTSGGALTAAVAWMGLLEQARGDRTPIGDRVLAIWKDLTAQTPLELALDRVCIEMVRLTEQGILPSFARSPSSLGFQLWSRAASQVIARPPFTDLRALLLKHIDFDALPTLVGPESPVLLVGAGDVLEGSLKVFSSAKREIKVESLLASAAIPNLFPAVWVDGHAYWDGIFATNPPVAPFLRRLLMGDAPLPEEIWVIQVNRAHHDDVPETPSDISDRRNHLAGNLSLQHELVLINVLNMLIEAGAMTDQFRASLRLDTSQPITVRFIRMSQALQDGLDYPSKLSREPGHIDRLIADGASQAREFLAGLGHLDQPVDPPVDARIESVEPQAAPGPP